jgi:Tfp pilus assembly protein PilX
MKTPVCQHGFLTLVAILLVLVVGFIAVAATYQFTGSMRASSDTLHSTQAFYLARSGLEKAEHTLFSSTGGGLTCNGITGNAGFTNASVPGATGQFTVTGASTTASTTLSGALTANATTIPLTSTATLTRKGSVLIERELVSYQGISSNNLINATRGVNNSAAVTHPSGSDVIQNQCVLTATGGVPDLATSTGKRTLRETIIVNSAIPTSLFRTLGTVTFSGVAALMNTTVTPSTANYSGANIRSGSTVSLGGFTGTTWVSSSSGGGVVLSSIGSFKNGDIVQNDAGLIAGGAAGLFDDYFTQSETTVKNAADFVYTNSGTTDYSSQLNGKQGVTIWIDQGGGTATINNATTLGTANNPVILVINGNLTTNNSLTVYGFVYIKGNWTSSGFTYFYGGFAMEGNYTDSSVHVSYFSPEVLSRLSLINGSFLSTPTFFTNSTKEIFP